MQYRQSTEENKPTGTQRETLLKKQLWNLLNSFAGSIFMSGFCSPVMGSFVYGVNLSNKAPKSYRRKAFIFLNTVTEKSFVYCLFSHSVIWAWEWQVHICFLNMQGTFCSLGTICWSSRESTQGEWGKFSLNFVQSFALYSMYFNIKTLL